MSTLAFEIMKSPELSVYQLPVLEDNYIYILREHGSSLTAVVDPALSAPVQRFLEEQNWALDAIFNTHHHLDHIGGNRDLRAHHGCPIYASNYDSSRIPDVTHAMDQGARFRFGRLTIDVKATPGHTLGHIVYHLPDHRMLFCGDTLFALGCGRLFEGTPEQMWQSLEQLLQLPGETMLCCAHEYTLANAKFAESLGHLHPGYASYITRMKQLRSMQRPTVPTLLREEKLYNPFLRVTDPLWASAMGLGEIPLAERFAHLRLAKDQFK